MSWDQEGIHENYECYKCGACCVYFRVKNDDGTILKKAGEICPNMDYDLETKTASCRIYDSESKPEVCDEFTCGSNRLVFLINYGKAWGELKELADRMSQIVEGDKK